MDHRTLDTVIALSIFAAGMVGAALIGAFTNWNLAHFILAVVGIFGG